MKVGDLVYNTYHNILRFGTIQTIRLDKSGWSYYKVNWHADETYEYSMDRRQRLTHKNHRLEEYRKDQIAPISKNFLSRVLQEHTK